MPLNFGKAAFSRSAGAPGDFLRDGLPQFAFAGRSNVGKSSVINRLLNRKNLAYVGASPGKTTQINYFLVDDRAYLVDLPGYGYAKRGKQEQENLKRMITNYVLRREQMLNLFVLIDSRHEPQRIAQEFIEFLGENGVPFSLVFTKADKLSHSKLNSNIQAYLKHLKETWEELPPHFATSAESRLGREELLGYIEEINRGQMD